MSKVIHHADPERPGHLIPVTYYDTHEAGDLLGVHASTVRKRCAAGRWPHYREEEGRTRYWMSADDIARVTERLRHDPDAMVIHYDDEPAGRHLIALHDDEEQAQ
jgi:hypothetical protein